MKPNYQIASDIIGKEFILCRGVGNYPAYIGKYCVIELNEVNQKLELYDATSDRKRCYVLGKTSKVYCWLKETHPWKFL